MRPQGVVARLYVLGPPADLKLLRRSGPSRRAPETYELAAARSFFPGVWESLEGQSEEAAPFAARMGLPLATTRGEKFFKDYYWRLPPSPRALPRDIRPRGAVEC